MKKLLILLTAALTAVILVTGCAAPEKEADSTASETMTEIAAEEETANPIPVGYRQISQEEARQMMESESGYIILDVRTPSEFDEGHIPGAICISHDSIPTDTIPELPDKDQLIMVYCRSGRRSKLAAEQLVSQGYTNIVEFGGINTWTGEVTTE